MLFGEIKNQFSNILVRNNLAEDKAVKLASNSKAKQPFNNKYNTFNSKRKCKNNKNANIHSETPRRF